MKLRVVVYKQLGGFSRSCADIHSLKHFSYFQCQMIKAYDDNFLFQNIAFISAANDIMSKLKLFLLFVTRFVSTANISFN